MKTLLIIFTLLLSVMTFGQTKAEKEVLALSKDKFNWMLENKLDSLSNVLDEQIILQHASGMIQSKDEYLETLRSGKLVYNKIDLKERSARIIGSTAIVMGKVDFNVTINGNAQDFNFSFTEVYTREKKKWKMVLYTFRKIQ
jgi:hypothetical protein